MGRPPLPLGTWGNISTLEVLKGSGVWRASARYRDQDGVTRPVTCGGKSPGNATNNLRKVLSARATPSGSALLNAESTLAELFALFIDESRDDDVRAQTAGQHEAVANRSILPQVGALRIRESNTMRLDQHVKSIRKSGRPTEARHVRTVLSLMFDFAVRMGVLAFNRVAGVVKVSRKKNEVRVLELDDLLEVYRLVVEWTTRKRPGPKVSTDLMDAVGLHLATGCRIGEILAFQWLDLVRRGEQTLLGVTGTLVTPKSTGPKLKRVTGGSLFRQPFLKADTARELILPAYAVELLERRRELTGDCPLGAMFVTRKNTYIAPNNLRRSLRAALAGSPYVGHVVAAGSLGGGREGPLPEAADVGPGRDRHLGTLRPRTGPVAPSTTTEHLTGPGIRFRVPGLAARADGLPIRRVNNE